MTSATDELRRMLDERGVNYVNNDFGITWSYYSDPHTATESLDGTLIVTGFTPEQAVAATLGCELNPDGLPVGLTISNDENLLNWRGENYVKQAVAATLGESSIEELEADIWRSCEHLTKASNSEILVNVPWEKLRGWLTEAATLGADDGSRWFELFGTPERAAQTLADNCPGGSCGGCPGIKAETCGLGDYDTLLEWLRGKAVKR